MTNTKELLELAARALGEQIDDWNGDCPVIYFWDGDPQNPERNYRYWNPATDDGDCARMEAALGINIIWDEVAVAAEGEYGFRLYEPYRDHNNDRQAARRMASLRCAAEIWKARES